MAHRSVSPTDLDVDADVDPFWQDAYRQRPPLLERASALARPARSWGVAMLGVLAVAGAGW